MADRTEATDALAEFHEQAYQRMTRPADAMFESTETLSCTDGPVRTCHTYGCGEDEHQ